MRNIPQETVTLVKHPREGGITAEFTRVFKDVNSKVLGTLVQLTDCDDAYVEQMPDGDSLPVVRNGKATLSFFLLPHGGNRYTMFSDFSYGKAKKVAMRQTSVWGKLRNRWLPV